MIEGHGNDLYRYGDKVSADFSSNVASHHVPNDLLCFISTQLEALATYPEPDSISLRKELGFKYSLSENQVFVTNGSVDAFYMIAAAFRESRSLILIPSFAEYEDACQLYEHTLFFKANDLFTEPFTQKPHLVWLGNPNNPDGRLYDVDTIRMQLKLNPDTIFVVDEAYGDLCLGFESSIQLLDQFENLIVVKSMTKQYVLPGLRLGYMFAGKGVAQRLRRFTVPWSVNAISQRVGSYISSGEYTKNSDTPRVIRKSQELQNRLATLDSLEVIPSLCNFFLIRLRRGNALQLQNYLIENYAILIRNASNFRGLDDHYFRVSVQSDAENNRLYDGVCHYLQHTVKWP